MHEAGAGRGPGAGSARTRAAWIAAGGAVVLIGLGLLGWTVWRRADPLSYGTYWVPSPAMEPTYEQGEILRVRDIDGEDARRGEVVIVHLPMEDADQPTMAIKRVVAVGGDEIGLGPTGAVLVNGEPVDEPYLAPGAVTAALTPQVVPAGHLFVLGDNREHSYDSRIVGPVPTDDVIAVVLD